MEIKKKSTLKWIGVVGFSVLIVVGVLLGTLLKKDKGVELVVTAQNIEVATGEKKQIEYKSSINEAVIRFRVADKSIAEIEQSCVIGKDVGETEIIITARYIQLVYEKRIAVVVTEKQTEEKPSEGDDKPNAGDNNGEDNPPPEEPELAEINLSGSGCTITGNNIEMTKGKTARVTVFAVEEFNDFAIESFSEKLEVKESEYSQRLLEIKANEEGEFDIKLKLDNKIATIKVKVKS